jgi:hypothetical protein
MSDTDPDVTELLADLTRSLQELEREIEPDRRLRPPTPGQLSQFASEVAIPGLILVLRTNIKALQLLQRTIRLAQGRDVRSGGSTGAEVRERAESLSRATLAQIDDTLSDIQAAVDGRPSDDETRELLSEARNLRDRLQEELEADGNDTGGEESGTADVSGDPVDIDVEAELRTLKDDLEDDDSKNGDGGPESPDSDGPADAENGDDPGEP